MVIDSGTFTDAETESVTVKVSNQVPTVAVSAIRKTTEFAVTVSIDIPGIKGDKEALYVGVPKLTVKVSLLATFIAFFSELPASGEVTTSAGLIIAKAVAESVIESPAVSESVTITR
jgi:hypothetical protein